MVRSWVFGSSPRGGAGSLCRARIGHTHLIHLHIVKKDPPPHCEHCQCIVTVRHNLVECNHFAQVRNKTRQDFIYTRAVRYSTA